MALDVGPTEKRFVEEGFVRLDDAFPRALADTGRAVLWADTGCDPEDPATWTKPVIRLGQYGHPPFREAASTPRLHAAFRRRTLRVTPAGTST